MHERPKKPSRILPEFGDHAPLDGEVDVGRVEDEEGRVAPQLQGDLLHRVGALPIQDLAWVERQAQQRLRDGS